MDDLKDKLISFLWNRIEVYKQYSAHAENFGNTVASNHYSAKQQAYEDVLEHVRDDELDLG